MLTAAMTPMPPPPESPARPRLTASIDGRGGPSAAAAAAAAADARAALLESALHVYHTRTTDHLIRSFISRFLSLVHAHSLWSSTHQA